MKKNSVAFTIRLNQKDYERIKSIAKSKKKSINQSIRELIRERAENKKIRKIEKFLEVNSEVYLSLSRVTGNINQLAHHLNAGNFVADSNDFFKTADELKDIVKIFLQMCVDNQKKIQQAI